MLDPTPPMHLFIYAMGPGETAQGAGLARHALAAGHRVSMAVREPFTMRFLDTLDCTKAILQHGAAVRAEIERGGYDAVVFCNSKSFGDDPAFIHTPPTPKPLTCSLDSNWLFDHPRWYPYIQWLDAIFLSFSPRIYHDGLRAGGGHYEIPAPVRSRIRPVGFIPSRRPLDPAARARLRRASGVQEDQRLVFFYMGRGGTYQRSRYPRYVQLMEACHQACGGALRVIHFGEEQPQAPWLLGGDTTLDGRLFDTWLAASDLVVQHHGLSTLMQAVAAQVPALVNVHRPRPGCRHAHSWEIGPFEQAGLCALHFFDDPLDRVVETMRALLFPSAPRAAMIRAQQCHFVAGEPNALAEIERLWGVGESGNRRVGDGRDDSAQ